MKPAPMPFTRTANKEWHPVNAAMEDFEAVLASHRRELRACVERWLCHDESTRQLLHFSGRSPEETLLQESLPNLTFSAQQCGMLLAASIHTQDSSGERPAGNSRATVELLKREAGGEALLTSGCTSYDEVNPQICEEEEENVPEIPGKIEEPKASEQIGLRLRGDFHGVVPENQEDSPDNPDLTLETKLKPDKPSMKDVAELARTREKMSQIKGGKSGRKVKKRESILVARKSEAAANQSLLERLVTSTAYEMSSGVLIVANSIFLGWETQVLAEQMLDFLGDPDLASPQAISADQDFGLFIGRLVFCILFSCDLAMRWTAEGLIAFWKSDEKAWNVMDLFIVSLGVVELFVEVINRVTSSAGDTGLSKLSVLKTMRFIRIVRVARVIRVMRAFKELRMMVVSIMSSMKSLLWVALVFLLVFYLFGITFTTATTTAIEEAGFEAKADESLADLADNFGSLPRSILVLYMAMSGGNDWGEFYNALAGLPWYYSFLFLLYITFALFGVVNIVTGVFVEGAMQASQADSEVLIHEEMETKKEYLSSVRKLLLEMDTDDDGLITLQELVVSLSDPRVVSYFVAMGLQVEDATEIFQILDSDQNGYIEIEEFINGCYRLQGAAKNLDTKITQFKVNQVMARVGKISKDVQHIKEKLKDGSNSGND